MYKIGDFAKISGASVKTLRYYDEIGLLKPRSIDNFTNYRYYSDSELKMFKRIEQLKKLGFTLEEIKNNINDISLECLEIKKQELGLKVEYMMTQIAGIEALKSELAKGKVKSLKG